MMPLFFSVVFSVVVETVVLVVEVVVVAVVVVIVVVAVILLFVAVKVIVVVGGVVVLVVVVIVTVVIVVDEKLLASQEGICYMELFGVSSNSSNSRSIKFISCSLPDVTLYFVPLRPNVGLGLPIHEVSRSHTATHHSR